jgi:membrane protease YdiL (CAAX protease family)
VVEWARLPVLVLLLLGFGAAGAAALRRPVAAADPGLLVWAACLAVALNLAWGGVPTAAFIGGDVACADRVAPFALLRVAGALLVLTSVALIVRLVRAAPREIGLRWPSRPWLLTSLILLPVIGAAAVILGPLLAEPFFGSMSSPAADLPAMAAALLFAVANASMEEVVYRGVLLRWLAPITGVASALALQAIVFGLGHGVGTDFIGSPLPVMAATAGAGLILGALALRTRSLLLPIAIHVALDIPVFLGKVCLGL